MTVLNDIVSETAIPIAQLRSQLIALLQPLKTVRSTQDLVPVLDRMFRRTKYPITFVNGETIDLEDRVAQGQFNTDRGSIIIAVDPTAVEHGRFSLAENPDGYIRALAMTISHEIVHREQWERSGQRLRASYGDAPTDAQYLANPHEITAKAKDAVEELMQYESLRDRASLVAHLRNPSEARMDSNVIYEYHEIFATDPSPAAQRVWRRFLRAAMEYAAEA